MHEKEKLWRGGGGWGVRQAGGIVKKNIHLY